MRDLVEENKEDSVDSEFEFFTQFEQLKREGLRPSHSTLKLLKLVKSLGLSEGKGKLNTLFKRESAPAFDLLSEEDSMLLQMLEEEDEDLFYLEYSQPKRVEVIEPCKFRLHVLVDTSGSTCGHFDGGAEILDVEKAFAFGIANAIGKGHKEIEQVNFHSFASGVRLNVPLRSILRVGSGGGTKLGSKFFRFFQKRMEESKGRDRWIILTDGDIGGGFYSKLDEIYKRDKKGVAVLLFGGMVKSKPYQVEVSKWSLKDGSIKKKLKPLLK